MDINTIPFAEVLSKVVSGIRAMARFSGSSPRPFHNLPAVIEFRAKKLLPPDPNPWELEAWTPSRLQSIGEYLYELGYPTGLSREELIATGKRLVDHEAENVIELNRTLKLYSGTTDEVAARLEIIRAITITAYLRDICPLEVSQIVQVLRRTTAAPNETEPPQLVVNHHSLAKSIEAVHKELTLCCIRAGHASQAGQTYSTPLERKLRAVVAEIHGKGSEDWKVSHDSPWESAAIERVGKRLVSFGLATSTGYRTAVECMLSGGTADLGQSLCHAFAETSLCELETPIKWITQLLIATEYVAGPTEAVCALSEEFGTYFIEGVALLSRDVETEEALSSQ